jgi:hypothetical protein
MRLGLTGFAEDVARHVVLLGERVPSFRRVLGEVVGLVAGDAGVRERLAAAWSERSFHVYYDRPALLLSCLRADALAEGPSHPLWRAMAIEEPDAAAVTRDAVRAALAGGRARLWRFLAERRVQTNETARAVTWLWPAFLAGCDGGARPIALLDVGASAGLNLVADALPAIWHEPSGAPIPVARSIRAVARVGLDARPIDVGDPTEIAWLRACLWPGERRRRERFEAAVAATLEARGRPGGPVLERASVLDAPSRLDRLAATSPAGTLVLAYQTIVRGYLEPDAARAHARGMLVWIAKRPPGDALWCELEMVPTRDGEPVVAAITAHAFARRRRLRSLEIARCGYHPVEITPDPAAVAELRDLLRPNN